MALLKGEKEGEKVIILEGRKAIILEGEKTALYIKRQEMAISEDKKQPY